MIKSLILFKFAKITDIILKWKALDYCIIYFVIANVASKYLVL